MTGVNLCYIIYMLRGCKMVHRAAGGGRDGIATLSPLSSGALGGLLFISFSSFSSDSASSC